MATKIKSIYLCELSKQVFLDMSPYSVNWYAVSTSSLAWVAKYQDSMSDNLIGFGINELQQVIPAGTYNMTFTLYDTDESGENLGDFYLEIIIPTACDHLEDLCCSSEAITLRWLNREGGISQWTFSGVRTYEVRLGDSNTFKNPYLQRLYSQRKDVYNARVISTKRISKLQMDYLDSLRYSIQVWEWDGTTATSILLDNDSFLKYKSSQNIYELSIKYIISQEIIIQTQ